MKKIKLPRVSIIIATKNEERNLPKLLGSIEKQTYRNIETIVVDNHSTDQTLNIAKRYTQYVYTKGPERTSQRNFGARKSHGKFLLFLDADMDLTPKVIDECVNVCRKKTQAIIIPEDVEITNFFSRVKHLEKLLYLNEPEIEAARFFNKDVFNKIGGYNESLISGEDWDLSQRVNKITKIGRIKSVLYHNENSLIRELRHKWLYAKQIKHYQKLHPNVFRKQSGINRLHLFWRKCRILFLYPVESIFLIILKSWEFCLFLLAKCIY